MSLGLYIHVPFCRSRCHFCAFYLEVYREDRAQGYLTALYHEIQLHAGQRTLGGQLLDTVYFGGGTPTALQPCELCEILSVVQAHFGLQPDAEITVEAHPDTITIEALARLTKAGFNRISFGVQSVDQHELLRIGRPSLAGSAKRAVTSARQAGFSNINLDLMFGLPGQTLESWQATLGQAVELKPTHLSCYALTVEEGTRLSVDVRRGNCSNPDDLLQDTMEEEALRAIMAAGFDRYEISNYCRPGYACRHNQLYWAGGDYLGLGPSAQSYVRGDRFGNVDDLAVYQDMLASGRLPIIGTERLPPEQQRREAIVFGLRLTNGIASESVHEHGMAADWLAKMTQLLDEGWLVETDGRIRLTDAGRRFADSVAVNLL